jgi:hypothetical protein
MDFLSAMWNNLWDGGITPQVRYVLWLVICIGTAAGTLGAVSKLGPKATQKPNPADDALRAEPHF